MGTLALKRTTSTPRREPLPPGLALTAPCAPARPDMPGPPPPKTTMTTSKWWNALVKENVIANLGNANASLASAAKAAAGLPALVTATVTGSANLWKSLPKTMSHTTFTKMSPPNTTVHGMQSTAMDASVTMAFVVLIAV